MSTYTLVFDNAADDRYVHPHARTLAAQYLADGLRRQSATLTLSGPVVPPLAGGGTVTLHMYDQAGLISVKPWRGDSLPPPAAAGATELAPVALTDAGLSRMDAGGGAVAIVFDFDFHWPLSGLSPPADSGSDNVPDESIVRVQSVVYRAPNGVETLYTPATAGPLPTAGVGNDAADDVIAIDNPTRFVLESTRVQQAAPGTTLAQMSVFNVTFMVYGIPVTGEGVTQDFFMQLESTRSTFMGQGNTNEVLIDPGTEGLLSQGDTTNTFPIQKDSGVGGEYFITAGCQFRLISPSATLRIDNDRIALSTSDTITRRHDVTPISGAFNVFNPLTAGFFTTPGGQPDVRVSASAVPSNDALSITVQSSVQSTVGFTTFTGDTLFTVVCTATVAETGLPPDPAVFRWATGIQQAGQSSVAALPTGPTLPGAPGSTQLVAPYTLAPTAPPIEIGFALQGTSATLQPVFPITIPAEVGVPTTFLYTAPPAVTVQGASTQVLTSITRPGAQANALLTAPPTLSGGELAALAQAFWDAPNAPLRLPSLTGNAALVQLDPDVTRAVVQGGALESARFTQS